MATKKFIRLITVVILILISFIRVSATVYYVSNTGNNGNNGTSPTQGSGNDGPWQTIAHVNSIFSGLSAGDQVLFKRGDTFSGKIIINKSGTASQPIFIGAYGTGARPVVTSLINITGWESVPDASGVYESNAFSALSSGLQIVLVNEAVYGLGRWPDLINIKVGEYRRISSRVGYTQITDNSLTSNPDWDGAEIVIHSSRWTIHNGQISSHSGTKLNYTLDIPITNPDGYKFCDDTYNPPCNGYFIQNHPKTLTKFGEWYYYSSGSLNDVIQMYFGGVTPSTQTVQAATENNLLVANGKSYITIDNLNFKGANQDIISLGTIGPVRCVNFTIKNCDIQFAGRDGIRGTSTDNLIVDNCNILYSYNDGIRIGSNTDAIITNNLINYTYWLAGMGVGHTGVGNGIKNGDNSLVQYNRILNSGYVGIHIGKNNSRVLNNFVDTALFVTDDGGGIYDYISHADGGPDASKGEVRSGQKVNGNIVMNMLGAYPGVKGGSSYLSSGGIYWDDNSNNFECKDNTIINSVGVGLYLHNAQYGIVTGNTSYNSTRAQYWMKDDGNGGPIKNITSTGNIFFSKLGTQPTANYEDMEQMGTMTWNNNYYARPIGEGSSIIHNDVNKTLATWKSSTGKDAGSLTAAPRTISNVNVLLPVYNDTKVPKTISLSGTYVNVKGQSFPNTITIDPWKSEILMKIAGGGNIYPTASITLPADGATFIAPANIIINATANDADGTVTGVVFLNGNTILGTDNSSPYSFTWNNVSAGSYTLTAKATDNNGAVTESLGRSIIVNAEPGDNEFPTASITLPANNATFTAPATVQINATASDPDGSVTSVVFLHGSTILSTDNSSPYSFTWNNVPIGNYSLTVRATDNDGAVTVSSEKAISVTGAGNIKPTVSITSPANNATFISPASIPFTAIASDADGSINKIEFYNGTTLFHTELSPPYEFTWNNVLTGNYFITARAYDNSGDTTTSAAILLIVNDQANLLPTVSITTPANNAMYGAPASITFNATAADTDGTVTKVEFFNDATLLNTDFSSPYSFTWNNVPVGSYPTKARATDNRGGVTTSAIINIIVNNSLPVVNITSPSNGSNFLSPATVNFNATASDANGTITQVEFFSNGVLFQTEVSAPYTFTRVFPNPDTYIITARATDNNGGTTTSTAKTFTVSAAGNATPTVNITTPENNQTFTSLADILLSASAADVDGTITKVDFYNGDILLFSDVTSPYSYVWNDVEIGVYDSVTARAMDDDGAETISALWTITVENINPTVAITKPVADTAFFAPGNVIIEAEAFDVNGTIVSVTFYSNDSLLFTDATAPYNFTWNDINTSVYNFSAVVIDNDGDTDTSNIVVTTVYNSSPEFSVTTTVEDSIAPGQISFDVEASDINGTISSVEFYRVRPDVDTVLIHVDYIAPYQFVWQGIPDGIYNIMIVVKDNDGAGTTLDIIEIQITAEGIRIRMLNRRFKFVVE